MTPLLFSHTMMWVWRSSPSYRSDAEKLCLRYGARFAPIGFQRILRCTRAVWKTSHYGLCKRTNFWTVKPLYDCCFSSGNEGLFCGTIFPKKPTFSLLEKDVRWKAFLSVLSYALSLFYLAFLDARLWVLFAYNFRCRGAKAYSTVGITIEWLTTIEQCKVAKYG